MVHGLDPLETELELTPVLLGSRTVKVWQVGSVDTLLERMLAQDPEVHEDDIPYYACVWPSARVLASAIVDGESLAGARVVELGCGCGLAGLAAAVMGAEVLMTDLQPAALALVRRNAEALGVSDLVRTQALDWREPGKLKADITVCSDVLYEARFVAPLLAAVRRVMKRDGVTLLADPSRPYLETLVERARAAGLEVAAGPVAEVEEGGAVRLVALRSDPSGRRAPWER